MTEESPQGKILLVDDNPTNIDVLHDFLSDLGYEVRVAEDGVSALNRIKHIEPDIILLDIMMPHMDGFEVCRRLKANPESRDIPIMFITAVGSVEDKVKGFELGAVDYITKPFQNQEILARVRTHLSLQRMQRELIHKNETLSSQNESLDAYARTVAHDLKNPLNLIMNFARLIEEEDLLEGTPAQDLKAILQSADQMNHIIQDLLLLAQMRHEEVDAVPVNMEGVVNQTLERLGPLLKEKHAVLELPNEWIDGLGIAPWVQAVWMNYISNAVKYGGNPPEIRLECGPSPANEKRVRYSVVDNGKGIPPGDHSRVFKEFARLGGEAHEGHGVGLSIVRRIISRLGGEVGVENLKEDSGCRFYFDLSGLEE